MVSLLWSVALLGGLLWTGLSLGLRSFAESAAEAVVFHFSPARAVVPQLTVIVYVCLLMLLSELGNVQIGFYAGFLLERRYGLSNERFGAWLRDRIKALGVGLIFGSVGASDPVYAHGGFTRVVVVDRGPDLRASSWSASRNSRRSCYCRCSIA